MKKIIAAGLMAGMAIGGLALGAGTANAYPPCQENWALDQATGEVRADLQHHCRRAARLRTHRGRL